MYNIVSAPVAAHSAECVYIKGAMCPGTLYPCFCIRIVRTVQKQMLPSQKSYEKERFDAVAACFWCCVLFSCAIGRYNIICEPTLLI